MGLFTSFQLKSHDPETRRRAALKLGVPGRRSSIDQLRPLLEDAEWSVREAAATALGAIADVATVPLLVAAIRGMEVRQPEGASAVRRAAIAALVGVGQPAVGPLLEALHDRDARLREAVLEALGEIGGPQSADALAAALADDRSNVRQAAAPALARVGGAKALPALRSALGHKDAATRRAAAAALGALSDPEAADALRPAAADRDRLVREAAMRSLAALKTSAAVDVLCTALLEGEREARTLAASALRSFEWSGDGPRQRAVHAVLHGRYSDAASEGAEAVSPLLASLADRDASARRGAAEALTELDDPRIVTALGPLLGDPDAAVRDAAATALARRGTASSAELARALGEPGAARDAAAKAMGLIGEARIASALVEPLLVGRPTRFGGLELRVLHDGEAMDEARHAAECLETVVAQLHRSLPDDSLRTIAALEDVMLVEAGQRPDPDGRLALDEVRATAANELERRGD